MQYQGPRGLRDPRQAPIPTTGPTTAVAGVADLAEGGGGFLRQAAQNYLPHRDDVVVPGSIARDYGLRDGTEIEGLARDGGGVDGAAGVAGRASWAARLPRNGHRLLRQRL